MGKSEQMFKRILRRMAGFIIYWFHVGIMTAFFFSGFFLSWQWIVGFYLFLELQLIIFSGCSITKLQQTMGDLQTDEDFIPALMKTVFHVKVTDMQHALISYVIMAFPVFVVLIRSVL